MDQVHSSASVDAGRDRHRTHPDTAAKQYTPEFALSRAVTVAMAARYC